MLKSYLSKLCSLALLLGMSFGAFAQNVTITAPANIAGDYLSKHAAFGPWLNGQSGTLVLANDGTGVSNGCTIINDMTGKIALIDRGVCGFAVKTANAEAAGAIGVIICNNNPAIPDSTILMGGGDCSIGIPAVMLSLNACNIIKAELANGVTATFPVNQLGPGEQLTLEIPLAGAGTYTATTISGGGSIFADATSMQVYSIVAPMTGVMNVNSCLGGADTRVTVMQGCRVPASQVVLGQNDDACEVTAGGDPYASSLDVIVQAGESYLIVWDNTWEDTGFDFNVSFGALPNVDVTFNVDMTYTAAAPDGVRLVFGGGPEVPMIDMGNNLWSVTLPILAGTTGDFRFANGAGNLETNPDLATCRTGTVGLDPVATIAYCYDDCFTCPPPTDCSNPNAIICDNFDSYAAGTTTGSNAPYWSTWSGTIGGAEDGIVSSDQFFSAPNSMLIQEGGTQDVLLLLGNRTSGVYTLAWKSYIPTGKIGYHNIQNEETPGVQWNLEVYFGQNGAAGAATPGVGIELNGNTTFSFPHDAWFDVKHVIDLDNDKASLFVDGNLVTTWDYTGNIGSIDFYSANATTNRMYVDDIFYEQLPSCRNTAIICDNLELYPTGGTTGVDGADWWSTWSGATGTAEDGILSSDQAYSGVNSVFIGNTGAQDVLLLLGNRSTGNYRLSWQMYIPTDVDHGYYNIQNEETAGVQWNLDVHFNVGETGTATPGFGVVDQTDTQFPVVSGQWFEVAHAIDLDNDLMTLFINGQAIETTAYTGNLGSVDFYSVDALNTYYIDDVELLELPSCNDPAAIICDGLEHYGPGTTIAGQAPWWSTWSGTAGGADDGFVSNETGAHGANSLVVPDNGTTDVLLLLGNQTTGNYTLSWNQFVAAGHVAYYNIQNTEVPGAQYNLNVHFGNNAQGVTAVFGQGVIAEGAIAFTYPEDTWFEVVHTFDLDNNKFDVWINGVQVITNANYTGGLGAIDFYSINPDNLYFIDDVLFVENIAPLPDVPVTFQVDMTWEIEQGMTVSASTVKIAGNFTTNGAAIADWTPPSSPTFTAIGNDIYEVTINFPGTSAGQSLQYKFLNTATTWGDCGEEQECFGADSGDCTNGAPDYNRLLVIPDAATTFCYTYNTCLGCNLPNSTRDLVELPMTIAPNPFSSKAIVTFHTPLAGAEARLTSMTGQLVRTYQVDGTQLTIEKDALTPGMYFFNVVTENGVSAAQKLVIQ